jgi:hypothetical protein
MTTTNSELGVQTFRMIKIGRGDFKGALGGLLALDVLEIEVLRRRLGEARLARFLSSLIAESYSQMSSALVLL